MPENNNILWHPASVTRRRREEQNGHKGVLMWFTGLSGAGKSTLAHAVEERLYGLGCRSFVFDGDNIRHGLNSDLGFSPEARRENLRRIGEVARLFVEAGIITLAAFISPCRQNRRWVRERMGDGDFIEVYCSCSLEICERRDVKGRYKAARAGAIPEFTGVSAPYEPPERPEIELDTGALPLEECVETVIAYLAKRG